MKKIFLCAWLLGAVSYQSTAQQKVSVVNHYVSEDAISNKGMVSQKIELKSDITPLVRLTHVRTEQVDQIPANIQISNSFEPDVIRLTERKKQIALVTIPAYRRNGATLERLISYDLEVTEYEDETGGHVAQKPTTVTNSVLATGTWYKIAAPVRGVYKIDYAFLQNIGVNPATVNPANIRVYGNGGTVMQEKVSSDQPDDLIENAVYVSSTGSSFGSGDYVLFYANGPIRWDKDSLNQSFTHTPNYYEDKSYYFLNFDLGAGKRIPSETATGTSSYNVTAFDDYYLIEHDSFNLGNMGKTWWGDKMNSINSSTLTKTFPVALGNIVDDVKLSTIVGSVADAGSTITMSYPNNGGTGNFYFSLSQAIGTNYFVTPQSTNVVFKPGSPNFNVTYKYSTGGTGAGYIDYLRFNYRRQPVFPTGTGQLVFRDWNTAGLPAGQNASYTLQNANANVKVWDITDPLSPVALNGTSGGSTLNFVRPGHRLREFVAYDGTQFNTPVSIGQVANQDLHGLGEIDLLIITPPEFKTAADEVAAFHQQKEGIPVAVAVTNQIYNEFSSGGQDIAGIRNFIKMFYDRAATDGHDMIKNVLFMGAASYDYKNRIGFNTNFVPTFQTLQSSSSEKAYSSDDFFSVLDDGENLDCDNCSPLVDVGTGRIPAFTKEEADGFVAKIKHYAGPESFGPWKNIVSYVADDRDENHGMNHMKDCETVSKFYPDSAQVMNVYKIYSDAYNKIATPSGARYPAVNKAIDDQIYNGTFLMSYSGHGSPTRWSHEAILTADDYGNWKNKDKLPVMVTATCDFGRFDDPANRSAGARLMINPNSGSIAMVTTTQIVYQYQNTLLNQAYTSAQFTRTAAGEWKTIGEALKEAKNKYPSDNNYKYVVLGDPALKLAMPVHTVFTDKLEFLNNGTATQTDTIKALGQYMLSGSVKDKNGTLVSDFNGPVYVTIFDKTRKIQVVNPEQDETPNFNLQTSIVAKVKGTAKNGLFTATFVAPKDINYEYGLGKISYYANTASVDASGLDTSFTVGDYNHNAAADNDAPIVKPYIDNEKFRNGGVTGPNPLLYVKLYDDNGINVSGNSIGHDLVAILDDDLQNPYVMNNYYETEQNDYRKGYVHFPLYNLPDGIHTLRVKAWDAYNNSGEGVVTFEVKNKDKGFISDLYTYPNPVTDITHIVFQHNQEGEAMDVTVQIFNAAGALARTLTESITTTGNRTEIIWDGLGQNGAPLQRGVYFYRLTARTSKGISATAYQKLVLMR